MKVIFTRLEIKVLMNAVSSEKASLKENETEHAQALEKILVKLRAQLDRIPYLDAP